MHNTTEISSDATLLLDLEGVAVIRVEHGDDGHRVVHVVTDDQAARACPTCGMFSTRVKQCMVTSPHDLPGRRANHAAMAQAPLDLPGGVVSAWVVH